MQQERERAAQEELMRQQAMQFGQQNQGRIAELEREILALRGEYERNQIMLERYDNVSPPLVYSTQRKLTIRNFAASESSRRRIDEYRTALPTTARRERHDDSNPHRSSHALAKQIRSSRKTLLATSNGASRHAEQVQEHATESQLGAGGDRQDGEDGEGCQDEKSRVGRYDSRARSCEIRCGSHEIGQSFSLLFQRTGTDCSPAAESKRGSGTTETRFTIRGRTSRGCHSLEGFRSLHAARQIQPTARGARNVPFSQSSFS